MKVKEIMTKNPSVCTSEDSLQSAAKTMCECDCGEVPVVDNQQTRKPIGVVTDRDIVCRAVAKGKNPLTLAVRDCITAPAVTIEEDADVEECCRLLEKRQIRRIPVVDANGRCCGIVSQADIARKYRPEKTAEVVREVSQAAA